MDISSLLAPAGAKLDLFSTCLTHAQKRPHKHTSSDKEEEELLDHLGNLLGDPRGELHLTGAGFHGTHQDSGRDDTKRMGLAEHGNSDAVETQPDIEAWLIATDHAEGLNGTAQTRQNTP